MAYWLVKSEPSVYSWDDFVKEGQTSWTGVRNYTARLHLRNMKIGDEVFFYHSNEGIEIIGIAIVIKDFYQDSTTTDERWVAVTLKPKRKLKNSVSLAEIKKRKELATMALIRISRLSVQPVTDDEYKIIISMGAGNR
ncbi:MAG: EVE domain-containing protein [Chitinophagaceae bacterium]|nr:MAG: EVE domain-containing protein [Chitinophagaceae bacterium]